MKFRFLNGELAAYLTDRRQVKLPAYCERAAFQLSEEVRGYDFRETGSDGQIHVSMFEHNLDEICCFVDWSVEIWNKTVRQEVHRSRRITTDELLANRALRDGDTPLESLLVLLEGWHEDSSPDDRLYVSMEKYPFSGLSAEPFATVGNLCAAVGLAVLDRLTLASSATSNEGALYQLGLVWEFALLARWNNHMDMAMHFEAESGRQKMVRAAKAKHSKDPRQHTKLLVRDLWDQWARSPSRYPSIAAFARDMCEKWPDHVVSEVVVARWVREWRRSSSK